MRYIFIFLLPLILFAQEKYFLPIEIESSSGRPIKNARVELYQGGVRTDSLAWHDAGRYYWINGADSIPAGTYDIYVNEVAFATNIEIYYTGAADAIGDTATVLRAEWRSDISDSLTGYENVGDTAAVLRTEWRSDIGDSATVIRDTLRGDISDSLAGFAPLTDVRDSIAAYNTDSIGVQIQGATTIRDTINSYLTDSIGVQVQGYDATLLDIADGIITEDLTNTDNPWADNEVANDLTIQTATITVTNIEGLTGDTISIGDTLTGIRQITDLERFECDTLKLGGEDIIRIIKVGTHMAIIISGADTVWAADDTTGF